MNLFPNKRKRRHQMWTVDVLSSLILNTLVHRIFPLGEAFVYWACGCLNAPAGLPEAVKKGKIIWNNLHSFKGNVKHFTAGLWLFLCCVSCLSCQKSFPAYRSSGSILLCAVCPSSSRALGLWSGIPFAIWLKIGGCWDKPGSWKWGTALSFFFFSFVLLFFNMGTDDPSAEESCSGMRARLEVSEL